MLAPGRDLTVDEVAEALGLPVAMIRRRIDAGDLPVRWVEVDGRLEVRVCAPGADGRPLDPARPQDGWPPRAAATLPPEDGANQGDTRVESEGSPVGVAGAVQAGRPGLTLPPAAPGLSDLDTRALVAGLLDRWERALERRIEAEQRLHFEVELERRARRLRELSGELDGERRAHAEQLADRERETIGLRARVRDLEAREGQRRPWWRRG